MLSRLQNFLDNSRSRETSKSWSLLGQPRSNSMRSHFMRLEVPAEVQQRTLWHVQFNRHRTKDLPTRILQVRRSCLCWKRMLRIRRKLICLMPWRLMQSWRCFKILHALMLYIHSSNVSSHHLRSYRHLMLRQNSSPRSMRWHITRRLSWDHRMQVRQQRMLAIFKTRPVTSNVERRPHSCQFASWCCDYPYVRPRQRSRRRCKWRSRHSNCLSRRWRYLTRRNCQSWRN